MDPTPEELAALEEQLNQSPTYQAFRANFGKRRLGDYSQLARALEQEGINLPHDYTMGFGSDGEAIVEKKGFFDRNGWAIPALIVGGTLTGGAVLAAAAPAAGAAATTATGAGAGVGIGETAAATGLTGSGFSGSAASSSILGTAGKVGSKLAPILGNAAANAAAGNRYDDRTQLDRDQVELNRYNSGLAAPTKRLATSQNASILKNWSPVKSTWGGPGSVAKGQNYSFEGGYNNPDLIDPRSKQLADDVISQQLEQQLAGGGIERGGPPAIAPRRRSSKWDKILGGAAAGSSILGAL